MVNENATHQKHVDEERQYVQDGRQKGQNGAPRESKLNAKIVQKLSKCDQFSAPENTHQ